MRRPAIAAFIAGFSITLLSAGVVGVFQGRVVLRKGLEAEAGILYVESRQGMARKVRVGDAVVEYDEEVPKAQRKRKPAEALCENTLVRVTAEQSDAEDGPWRAISILILPEPKRNGVGPGQSFSLLPAMAVMQEGPKSGSKGQAGSRRESKGMAAPGASGSCWAK